MILRQPWACRELIQPGMNDFCSRLIYYNLRHGNEQSSLLNIVISRIIQQFGHFSYSRSKVSNLCKILQALMSEKFTRLK